MSELNQEDINPSATASDTGTPSAEVDNASLNTEGNASSTGVETASQNLENAEIEQTPQKTQRNIEAELGKISSLEKERNEYKQYLEDTVSSIAEMYKGDPSGYEKFRENWKRKRGEDLPDYQSVYGGNNQQEYNRVGATSSYQDPILSEVEVLKKEVLTLKAQTEQEKKQVITEEVYTAVPELRITEDDTPETITAKTRDLQDIFAHAAILVKRNPDLVKDREELFRRSSLALNLDTVVDSARFEGEMLGRANAYARNTGADSGQIAQGGSIKPDKSVIAKLSPIQRKLYDNMASRDRLEGTNTATTFLNKYR